jgi:class 3 adenylate cyclase
MKPPIRFLTTSDGIRIACCSIGHQQPGAPTMVFVRGWMSNIELAWDNPDYASYFEALARHMRIVFYDMRGNGASDHRPPLINMEAALRDLETVMDQLELMDVVLYGQCFGGPIAIAYTARHAGRVSKLILDGTYARGRDVAEPEQAEKLLHMLREEPEAAMLALSFFTDPEPKDELTLREHYRELRRAPAYADADVAAQLYSFGFHVNVSDLLWAISVPALVMHRRDNQSIPFPLGRDLASRIPGAQFVALDGKAANPWNGDPTGELAAVAAFLDIDLHAHATAEPAPAQSLVTVLFTDMEASTSQTQRLGDAGAQELVRAHNTAVRAALRDHGGSEIKHTGDGIMASFSSASRAVECAMAIQQALAREVADRAPVRVRIGLNAGEPVAEERDLFGTAVQVAKRVCDRAEPGQILASNVVRELCAGKGYLFSDRGAIALRGFDDPVRLYEVRWSVEARA